MAKEDKKKKTPADADGESKMVCVRVKRAIVIGGVKLAPVVDGKKVTPVEAIIPRERAIAYGKDDVDILADAADAADDAPIGVVAPT